MNKQDKEQQKAINEEEKLNKTLDILDEVLQVYLKSSQTERIEWTN